jgi:hypothetical protein
VSIDELVTGVAIALGRRSIADCRALDSNDDGHIGVAELVAGVSRLLLGCDGTLPTPTRTPSGAQSVCGGPITSAPKLCNLRISPPRVRRGGNITISFGLSDLEGDLNTICAGIGPDGAGTPALTAPPPARQHDCHAEGDVGPIQVDLPIGRYIFAPMRSDRSRQPGADHPIRSRQRASGQMACCSRPRSEARLYSWLRTAAGTQSCREGPVRSDSLREPAREARLRSTLKSFANRAPRFPRTNLRLRAAVRGSAADLAGLRDPCARASALQP